MAHRLLVPVTLLFFICATPHHAPGTQRNSSLLYRKAAEIAQSGNLQQAVPLFREVIKLSPHYTKGHYGLGKALLYKEETVQEGIQHLQKAVSLDRRNASAFFYLGIGYMLSKNYMNSIDAFQKAYQLDPNMIEALFNIGAAFDIMENKKQSARYFRLYLEKQQRDDSDILF
jgi:tetratricopeptide (TPR) repeat protein